MEDVAFRYQQILSRITRFENGDVSDSMARHGLIYKKNYGVSIPVIDLLAKEYSKDTHFASHLWNQEERECKLLALRIFDEKSVNEELINQIIERIENSELAEQTAQCLFIRLENSSKIAIALLKNTNEYCNLAGLNLISKIAQTNNNLTNEIFIRFIDEIKNLQLCHSFHQKRGLARALLQIGLKNTELKHQIINWIDTFSAEHNEYKNWLDQEVKYYLTN